MRAIRARTKSWAFSGCAVAALAFPALASAQATAPGNANQLEQVVVTATRQADTVNRVPLSITAATQQTLDQNGVKTASDLQGEVPALTVSQARGPGVANLTVRGISDLQAGAPTTSFYIDDTNVSKRATNNTTTPSGNGSPVPPLFDLERVEVLRGPQGTLYGGSSEGGTVRYITPDPSLNHYSEYLRSELSGVKYGGTNYELGVAVGGPIIQDKLGFRVSMYGRHDAGWQNLINQTNGATIASDINSDSDKVFRGAVTWAPVENLRITAALLSSFVHSDDNNFNGVTLPTGVITQNTVCFNTSKLSTLSPAAKQNPSAEVVPCGTAGVTYTRPGYTLPAVNYGPNGVVARGQNSIISPEGTQITLPTLTVDWDAGPVDVKSITSFTFDKTKVVNGSGCGMCSGTTTENFTVLNAAGQQVASSAANGVSQGPTFLQDEYPTTIGAQNSLFFATNKRFSESQEFRISSRADAKPFSWVAGVYLNRSEEKTVFNDWYSNLNQLSQMLYGVTELQRLGVPPLAYNGLPSPADGTGPGNNNLVNQTLFDTEMAVYGEANYWVFDRLRLTAGVRISREGFKYQATEYGPNNGLGSPLGSLSTTPQMPYGGPGVIPQGVSTGKDFETPITPKFGAEYQFTDDKMVYFTAAKGFRPGGSGELIPLSATTNLAPYGVTPNQISTNYTSDSVWSYELGTKLSLLGRRLQINADVYHIDWTNVQVSAVVTGSVRFTSNAGSAVSQGFEAEANALITRGLTVHGNVGYDRAKYTSTALGVPQQAGFAPFIVALKGQSLPVPRWTYDIGAHYEYDDAGAYRPYINGDFRFTGALSGIDAQTWGNTAYAPDNVYVSSQNLNLRAGVLYKGLDVNVFANNALNYQKGNIIGGRTSCATATAGGTPACTSFKSYNPYFFEAVPTPRVVGIQIAYRH